MKHRQGDDATRRLVTYDCSKCWNRTTYIHHITSQLSFKRYSDAKNESQNQRQTCNVAGPLQFVNLGKRVSIANRRAKEHAGSDFWYGV